MVEAESAEQRRIRRKFECQVNEPGDTAQGPIDVCTEECVRVKPGSASIRGLTCDSDRGQQAEEMFISHGRREAVRLKERICHVILPNFVKCAINRGSEG